VNRKRAFISAAYAALFLWPASASAAIPLANEPAWESEDDDYATGGLLWDLDGDGYLDLVVGNGNDMDKERDAVFYNGRGELEREASWRSVDFGYDGHIDAGDVDGDGDFDVVVTGFLAPHLEQLYRNDDGMLTPYPAWMNADEDDSFACALGDVDGDGDLDLATVSGYFRPGPVRVYTNDRGSLEAHASWYTPKSYNANDVGWCDVDGDGDLDLAIAGHGEPCYLFENEGGVLGRRPAWRTDLSTEFNQLTFGDVNGDGWRDMVVSDNLPGGRVLLYLNKNGALRGGFDWSAPIRYASCVKLADVEGDGDLDLAAGGWWSPIQVFENVGGKFGSAPAWSYYPADKALVCEQAVWGDVDNDGLRFVTAERYDGDGARKLWYLEHAPVHAFAYVRVDGRTLEPGEFCFHAEDGWVSFARAPRAGRGNVEFGYAYSTDLDIVVTNWDEPAGSFLFENMRGGAVQISGFGILPADRGLTAKWTVLAGASKLSGFNLYRRRVDVSVHGSPLVRVNDALITGSTSSFAYTDVNVAGGATYDYWLEARLAGGGAETFGPKRGWVRKTVFVLSQNYPNPARTTTTIPFSLENPAGVSLALYDLAGRRVATLFEGLAYVGGNEVRADVSRLPPGVYVYRLEAASGVAAKKMVIAR
jgi:hypothetical protein